MYPLEISTFTFKYIFLNWRQKHNCLLTFASIDGWSDVWGSEEVGYSHDGFRSCGGCGWPVRYGIADGQKQSTGETVKPPLPTATTQSVRNHQCPSVCYHVQLTTWVHSTQAWIRGQGTCQFVLYQVDSLRRSEVKLRRTYIWTDFGPEALNRLWPGGFFLWTKQHEVEVIFGGWAGVFNLAFPLC